MTQPSITVVAATNRPGALTTQVADHYATLLQQRGIHAHILSLTALPADFTASALYANSGKNEAFNRLRHSMEEAQKYVFITPEYNGSFPGVLKAFIDGLQFPSTFKDKKCALIGVSKGPQGGALALSHLTDIFNYLRMHVHPLKLRLANVHDGQLATLLANSTYTQLLAEQADAVCEL